MSNYQLHQIWETPPVTKLKDMVQSPVYEINGKVFAMKLVPPPTPKEPYSLYVIMDKAPQNGHLVQISVKLLGRKKREFTKSVYFDSAQNLCVFENLVQNSELKTYSRKDKLSIDLTITHAASQIPDYRTTTGYVGLINKSATCYMNSALEMLFHTMAFRKLIYSVPYDKSLTILHALQRLFVLLQLSPSAVSTDELIQSFGWTQHQSFVEHDIQEFIRVLLSNLETKLKSTELDGKVAEMFRGTMTHYIKCINIDYQSTNKEDFYDLSVVVDGFKCLEDSLASSVEDEVLNGDNQYSVPDQGKQDAVMGYKISKLPPILHIHLSRFRYSPTSITGMEKVTDSFEFPAQLDMAPYVDDEYQGDTKYELITVLVHISSKIGGHYISYCRTSTDNRWFLFNDSTIEEVDATVAMNKNFGGDKQLNHAYYLCYARVSDMQWIMEKIADEDIPTPLMEFFDSIKDTLDTKMATINVVNMNKKIRIPPETSVGDLIREIKKINSNVKDLWTTGRSNFPIQLIDSKQTVMQAFGSIGRVYAAEFQAQKPNPVAFHLYFFFRDADEPLQDLGFMSFSSSSSTIEKIMIEIKKRLGFPLGTKLLCYRLNNDDQIFEMDSDRSIACDVSGTLILELAPESQNVTASTFVIKEPKDGVMSARNLLPDIKLDTVERFVKYRSSCIHIKIIDYNDSHSVLTTIEIPQRLHLRVLMLCIKKALNLPDDESILLYLPSSLDKTKPQATIINKFTNSDMSSVFDLRGNVRVVSVFCKKITGVSQADADRYIHLVVPIYNSESDPITTVELDMLGENTVHDLLDEVHKRDDVPNDSKLRMLLLSHSTIEKTAEETDQLVNYADKEVRIEIIPDAQLELDQDNGDFLIRCAFSTNAAYPINSTLLTPFYFNVIKDEQFETTKLRITSMIQNDFGDLEFVFYGGKAKQTRLFALTDDMVLSQEGSDPDAMLYIIISREALFQLYSKMTNQELVINN